MGKFAGDRGVCEFGRILRASAALISGTLVWAFAATAPAKETLQPWAQRPLWTTSRVKGWPEKPPVYRAERVFEKVALAEPVYLCPLPGTRDLIVVQLKGDALRFANNPDVSKAEVFLPAADTWDTYSLVFHPKFAENRQVYVFRNNMLKEKGRRKRTRISRFKVSTGDAPRCIPQSEEILLEYRANGHNGGDMVFGPDGYLYISSGDGSSDSDTDETGQDLSDLNSAILRIDVDHRGEQLPYRIPRDNPFVSDPWAEPEIWAFGLRNPWRMSFDAQGRLWTGDVGQDLWESIFIVERGGNYGWSIREGQQPFREKQPPGPGPIRSPIVSHPHSESRSITGGFVYAGSQFKDLQGRYVYGDYETGTVWALPRDAAQQAAGKIEPEEIARTPLKIVSFGLDHERELYLVDHGGGIYRFAPAPPPEVAPEDFPRKLSQTGLFASVADYTPAAGIVPYSVNAPLWSDGAMKERWMALPGESTIVLEPNQSRGWTLPEGAVLVKTFAFDAPGADKSARHRVETRLLTKQQGQWYGYTYAWNNEQTDATLVEARGRDTPIEVVDPTSGHAREQVWHFPSRSECMVCHTRAARFVLGVSTLQMNKQHDHQGDRENQLRTLERLGKFSIDVREHIDPWEVNLRARWQRARDMVQFIADATRLTRVLPRVTADVFPLKTERYFGNMGQAKLESVWAAWKESLGKTPRYTHVLPQRPEKYPALANPYDKALNVDDRARAYLHSNCSFCHVAAGGGNSQMELEVSTRRDKMMIFDVAPQHDTYRVEQPRLVAPGDPERSILLRRMAARPGAGRMPPLSTSLVDEQAVELLRQWIEQMGK